MTITSLVTTVLVRNKEYSCLNKSWNSNITIINSNITIINSNITIINSNITIINSNINSIDSQLSAMGTATRLGTRQGTGTVDLNDSITNYRFIFIRVGHYESGYPSFGNVCLPVTCVPISTGVDYNYKITCSDYTTFYGAVSIRFDTATKLNVLSTFDSTKYTVCHGIS